MLGSHIQEKRLRLVKNEILLDLHFIDLGICVDGIKRKHTKYIIKKATIRSL